MALNGTEIRFGTDGWRAVMCDEFTFPNVRVVCQAIAEYLQESGTAEKGVLVAHDARFLAEQFAETAAEVMVGNRIPVWLPKEDVPTPAVAHAVLDVGAAGAIMFTASHNPSEYNGIKFIPYYGGPATKEITSGIESHLAKVLTGQLQVKRKSLEQAHDLVHKHDPKPAYFAQLKKVLNLSAIKSSGLVIAYDAMYGSGRTYLPALLEEAGINVTSLHTTRDPLFGGTPPEPMGANLTGLSELVRSGKAQIGLANDGDADRFGIIDADGQYMSPNEVVSLLLPYLVEHRGMKGSVIRTVATTHFIDRLAKHLGLEVHETPVGFKHICTWMRQEPVIIGGEESGGLSIGGHVPEKDGILAALLVAEAAAVLGLPLRRSLDEWGQRIGPAVTKRVDLRYPDEKKAPLLQALRENPPANVGERAVESVITVDGAKYVFVDNSWALVRASGTEPLLRIYLEAADEASLSSLERDVLNVVDRAV